MTTPASDVRNAAHSALFYQEILLEILGYLSAGLFTGDKAVYFLDLEQDLKPRWLLQKTLLSCALTCRAFSDLALEELWRSLDHHVFVLKLLPWTTRGSNLSEGVLDLEPAIDEGAWSRFRWYARFVREMKSPVHTETQIGVHCNTWTLLASRLQGEPLFPSLRRLQVPADVEDILPFLFCLSPTIHSFTLEFEYRSVAVDDRDFLLPFLTLISDSPGHVLEPAICQYINCEGNAEEIMYHLRTSARLVMLEELDLAKIMFTVDNASVVALSRLPSLRSLTAGLSVRGPSDTLPPFTFSGFASLHHLSLNSPPLFILSEVLASSGLHTTPLRSVELPCDIYFDRNSNDSPSSIVEFQQHLALTRTALPDTLEALNIRSFCVGTRTEPLLPLTTLFAPFLSLGRLKTFDISFFEGCVLHVSDDDLRGLAGGWPHLEVLHVWMRETTYASDFSTAPATTVAGLLELAKGCPRLRLVTLPALDVSELPELSALPREGHKEVQLLDMSALVKDEGVAVEDVARVLDTAFPCLSRFSHFGVGTPRAKSWHEVKDAMMEMQAARHGFGRED